VIRPAVVDQFDCGGLGTCRFRAHIGLMQIQCPKCSVIVAIGTTRWFFDGGECMELRGTEAGGTKAYEQCQTLCEAVSKAEKNVVTKAPQRPQQTR
jgi:hypothetical protein